MNWVGTKAQQAQAWYKDTREYIVEQAQATRKKAEARIRKMCEGASKVWKSTTQAVDTFVKKHEGTIKAAIGIGTIILTVIPATAPIGIVLGTALSVASVNNAVTGKDWLTGRELGTVERVVDGVFGGVGTLAGTSTIAKQAVNTGLVDNALKLANSGLDSVKNALKPSTPATTPTPQNTGGSLKMDLQFFGGKGDGVASGIISNSEHSVSKVGRWMSESEYEKMLSTGKVQVSLKGNTTYIANPSDVGAFPSAPKGSIYVEFDVATDAIRGAGKPEWGQIPGPGSFLDRLDQSKGLPPISDMPNAINIIKKGMK